MHWASEDEGVGAVDALGLSVPTLSSLTLTKNTAPTESTKLSLTPNQQALYDKYKAKLQAVIASPTNTTTTVTKVSEPAPVSLTPAPAPVPAPTPAPTVTIAPTTTTTSRPRLAIPKSGPAYSPTKAPTPTTAPLPGMSIDMPSTSSIPWRPILYIGLGLLIFRALKG